MAASSIGPRLRRQWGLFSRLPAGRWLFSRVLGCYAPYTASIGATVREMAPGRCVVVLRERRRVRNHLHSVHAMALSNLAEMASGLALLNALPPGMRGILQGFEIEYLKKSRGTLVATCTCQVPSQMMERRLSIWATITDATGDTTARACAHWLIGPEPGACMKEDDGE